MTTLNVPATFNYAAGIPGGQTNIDIIQFTNSNVTATFGAFQFDNVVIRNNVQIRGSLPGPSHLAVLSGSIDASLWTFQNWDSLDSITLTGGTGSDTIIGSVRDDRITGGLGDDVLRGGTGNDVFIASANAFDGIDQIEGGLGQRDRIDYSAWPAGFGITVTLNAGNFVNVTGGHLDIIRDIEDVTGTSFADSITGDSLNNQIQGLGGEDILRGGGGDDILEGGLDGDSLVGGDGVDLASYASAAAGLTIRLDATLLNTGEAFGDGYVTIEGVIGSSFNDAITGTSGDNELYGGGGDDTLTGGGGADKIEGNERFANVDGGLDTYVATGAADGVDEITDVEILDYRALGSSNGITSARYTSPVTYFYLAIANGDGDYVFEATPGGPFDPVRTFLSGAGDDILTGVTWVEGGLVDGGGGNDTIVGSDFGETINGGAGGDKITGGGGNDILNGGVDGPVGVDYFYATSATDGADTIDGGASNEANEIDYSALGAANPIFLAINDTGAWNVTVQGGDTDSVSNVRRVRGTQGDDYLVGGAAGNDLAGEGGDDTLIGSNSAVGGAITLGSGLFTRGTNTGNSSVAAAIDITAGFSTAFDADIIASQDVAHRTITSNAGDTIAITHFYKISLTNGQQLFLDLRDTSFDSVLRLRDPTGALVSLSDDALGGTGSFSCHHAAQTGFYTIEIGRAQTKVPNWSDYALAALTGADSYDLRVSVARDAAATGSDLLFGGGGADVIIDGRLGGNLTGAGDRDIVAGGMGDDTLNLATGGWTPGEVLDGGQGVDTLRVFDGIAIGGSLADSPTSIERISIVESGELVLSSAHIAVNRISPNLLLSGHSTAVVIGDAIEQLTINMPATASSFTAAGFTFAASWEEQDRIVINGGASSDGVTGSSRQDRITGGAGDDLISGGLGADIIDGDAGSDTSSYATKTTAVVVFLDGANDVVVTVDGAAEDTIREIENINGGSANDSLVGDGLANILNGNGGQDFLFSNGFNPDGTMKTAAGNDTLSAGPGDDGLFAGDGDDALNGGDGADGMVGGGGTDTLNGGIGGDFLFGGFFTPAGALAPGSGNDTLNGEDGNDGLWGQDGADTINGGAGDDYVEGGDGIDTINGGAGGDTILGQGGADVITGGAGFDYLYGGAGGDAFILNVNDSYDTVWDFVKTEGDTLRLDADLGVTTFAQFQARITGFVFEGANYTVLNFAPLGHNEQITVKGVATNEWTAGMVSFV